MGLSKPIILSSLLVLSLSACQSTPWKEYNTGDPVKAVSQKDQILASARQATLEKNYVEIRSGALKTAEDAYRQSPSDPYAALNYAQILRRVNMPGQAEMVLKPFVDNPSVAGEGMLLEYAKLKLATGDFDTAQMMAQEANFQSESAESTMILGIALDAQGHHVAAENHFRQALNNAGADAVLKNKITNNLAVSLIAQGRRNEADLMLSQVTAIDTQNDQIIEGNRKLAQQL